MLRNDQHKAIYKDPVSAQVVKESLKEIILSEQSELDKFVTNRFLYFFGFLTGWNPKIVSLELIPIAYFFIWAIVLFGLRNLNYAYLFLASGLLIFIYFILLHIMISSWDKIKLWFIKRARQRGSIKNLTIEDIKYLLIYTRRIFGVKTYSEKSVIAFNPEIFRKLLLKNKTWQYLLNVNIILDLFIITGGGIYLYIKNIDIIIFLTSYYYILILIALPIFVVVIGLVTIKFKLKDIINSVSINEFDKVLKILNEFEIFGIRHK